MKKLLRVIKRLALRVISDVVYHTVRAVCVIKHKYFRFKVLGSFKRLWIKNQIRRHCYKIIHLIKIRIIVCLGFAKILVIRVRKIILIIKSFVKSIPLKLSAWYTEYKYNRAWRKLGKTFE